ncbi:tRNA pseudouridine synthase D family [Cryptosporidium sp. chipmunk genotype I]|uniref:tRNA pseudouridine synthase D family n=1 Tax=Cryptosporidium sp. chipmunk genotype I TaxID=1280935 RepID=UPI00351A244C|nr:tRNA pseudouridine synthase D family [Cryptosporidium sp. chipmunk genotype I]
MRKSIENEYGIDEFIRSSDIRLKGTIKKYFEDFHVHEIQNNGNVCSISSLRNKHDIIKEIQERKKILSGDNILISTYITISPELINNLENLGISQYCINNLITFITILSEIKKLTNNSSLSNRMFKLDNRGNLKSIFELKIKLYYSCLNKITAENNLLLNNSLNELKSNKYSINAQKEKRKKFHKLIKEFIPFITSQTLENSKYNNTLNQMKSFQYKDISISNEIFNEISKFFKVNEIESDCLKNFKRQVLSHDCDERQFDIIVLRPSNDYIYSLRNVMQNIQANIDNRQYNLEENEIATNTAPACKKQRLKCAEPELITETKVNLTLGSNERWNPNIPDYIHFTIYKENRDTADAINMISKCLKRNHKFFGIAGLKDRRGITLQRASAYRVLEDQLIYSTASKSWDRNIRISDFKYENKQINIGDLNGNLFHVIIRDLEISNANLQKESANEKLTLKVIDKLIGEVKSSGFINYFGLQRFGTSEIPTYKIGISLLKKEWKKAFYLILGFDEQKISSYSAEKKEFYNQIINEDFEEYRKSLSNHSYLEKLILDKFIKAKKKIQSNTICKINEDIYRESINLLPKNSYSLYIHSLQSLFFNIIASERIKKFGKNPVIGDLVMVSNLNEHSNKNEDSIFSEKNVIVLESQSELDKFTIQDVVLTLPGDDVIYPPIMKEKYEELMKKFMGMSIQRNCMGINGAYRKILVVPDYINYVGLNIIEKKNDDENKFPDSKVILSDLDILTVHSELRQNLGRIEPVLSPEVLSYKCDNEDGDSQVNTLVFSCKLPKSSYVTMALREFLGNSPSEKQQF